MIILESIRLRNFRSIREAVFKPKLDGITGIFGSNGAGKTTFLAGTLFALFGTKPTGASVASLRRIGSSKEECSASVVFTHLGQTVEIIRELKGSNNRVVVDIYVDGVPHTVTSVGAADTWISQRLGMDSQGFLTAFIVRQKELDALVTARPAERKQIIEKLAGIETINEALKKARKDENLAKEILNSLPGSETAINEAEAQVVLLSDKVEELSTAKEEKQAELVAAQAKSKELATSLETMRSMEAGILRNEAELKLLNVSIESANETMNRLSYVENAPSEFDIDGLRKDHQRISAELNSATGELNAYRVQKAQAENAIESLTIAITDAETKIQAFDTKGETFESIENGISTIEKEITELRKESTVAHTKAEDYREKVSSLSGDTHACPTCSTVLDDPAALIDAFEKAAMSYEEQSISCAEKVSVLSKNLQELASSKKNLENFEILNQKLATDKATLANAQHALSLIPSFDAIEATIEKLNEERDKVTELGINARRILEDKTAYSNAKATIASSSAQLGDLERTLSNLRKSFSPEKYARIRSDSERVQNEVTHLSARINEAYAEYSVYESRLSVANNNLRSSTEQWKRKKDLLVAQEKKALTTELIDNFRRDSVASLAPELSEYATDLISEITNGSYTEIRLDDDFNVTVINSSGEERSVGWLSGGEESAVAFALRLAIAFLITGGNPTLLWMDEVLTAQDPDRRSAMLGTIRNLPIDQIIMINHTPDAGDIVDKAVTVIPNLEKGSTLESDDGANDNLFEDEDDTNPTTPSSLDDVADDIGDEDNPSYFF